MDTHLVLVLVVVLVASNTEQAPTDIEDYDNNDVEHYATVTEVSTCVAVLTACIGYCTDNRYSCQQHQGTCVCYKYSCFHGSNRVQMRNGRQKFISDLLINDEVLTVDESDGQLKYQPVITDIHRHPNLQATFYTIRTDMEEITLTSKHYLHKGCLLEDSKLVTAEDMRVGDMLMIFTNHTLSCQPVTNIDIVTDVGIYNPVVSSGNIIVNNVYASVYADDIRPLTPRVSHLLSWLLRQASTMGGARQLLDIYHPHSGMPYWAHYLDIIRQSIL